MTRKYICEEQNFRYSLIYGTFIGSVRHHGYIPWDDDVDIMMPRRDYDWFLEYMKIHREEYSDWRIFNLEECKEYPYMITRISDDRYIIKMENEKPYGIGVFIDIYPYDGLGTTEKEAVTYDYFQKKLNQLVKLKEYEDSNYIGCVVWLSGGKKEIFLRKWFDETVMVPFEKYQFSTHLI